MNDLEAFIEFSGFGEDILADDSPDWSDSAVFNDNAEFPGKSVMDRADSADCNGRKPDATLPVASCFEAKAGRVAPAFDLTRCGQNRI
jgi:hypothetical protein